MNTLSMRAPLRALSGSNATLLALVLTSTVVSYILWTIFPDIDDENHLLEWLQALFLALACYVHARRAYGETDRDSLRFLMHAGLSVLIFGFLLRELDIDQFGEAMAWTYAEKFLRLVELLVLLRLLVFAAPRLGPLLRQAPRVFRMRITIVTMLGGLLMAAGWPFDKKIFHALPDVYAVLFEEILELDAYLLLFCAALIDTSGAASVSLAPSIKSSS